MKRFCSSWAVNGRIGGLGEKSAPASGLPRPVMPPAGGPCAPRPAGAGAGVCDAGAAGCDCANSDRHATDIAITLAGTNHVGLGRELDFIAVDSFWSKKGRCSAARRVIVCRRVLHPKSRVVKGGHSQNPENLEEPRRTQQNPIEPFIAADTRKACRHFVAGPRTQASRGSAHAPLAAGATPRSW